MNKGDLEKSGNSATVFKPAVPRPSQRGPKSAKRCFSQSKVASSDNAHQYIIPTATPNRKTTCLIHRCIMKNDMEGLKMLLSNCKRDCINDYDHFGRTPLHLALQLANPKALYLLLYYPLVHPSKLFATIDWTDILDSANDLDATLASVIRRTCKSTIDDDKTDKDNVESSVEQVKDPKKVGRPPKGRGAKKAASPLVDATGAFKLGHLLLDHWTHDPGAYIKSVTSLEGENPIFGCGIKQVEDVYREHYNYLVGRPHVLERAARDYTAKYSRIYIRHPLNVSIVQTSPQTKPDDTAEVRRQRRLTRRHLQQVQILKQTPLAQKQATATANANSLGKNSPGTQSNAKIEPRISYLPLETVDLMATFDKTSPLFLLFSNVNVPDYHDDIMSCFRILLHYFRRPIEPVLGFSQDSNGGARETNVNATPPRRLHQHHSQSLDDVGMELSNVDISPNKSPNAAKDSSVSPKKRTSVDLDNSLDDESAARGERWNWMTKTSCYDPLDEQKSETFRRRCDALISGHYNYSKQYIDPESGLYSVRQHQQEGQQGGGEHRSRFKPIPADPRVDALNYALMETLTWLKPRISWYSFIYSRDYTRCTILHKLSSSRDIDFVRLALASGCSPLAVNEAGDLPVHISLDVKDPRCFLELLHATFETLYKWRTVPTTDPKNMAASSAPIHEVGLKYIDFLNSLDKMAQAKDRKVLLKFDVDPSCAEFVGYGVDPNLVIFQEMLLLAEQLILRAIKFQSWDCMVALLNYNVAVTIRVLHCSRFMHKFVNYAHTMGHLDDFMHIVTSSTKNGSISTAESLEDTCTSPSANISPDSKCTLVVDLNTPSSPCYCSYRSIGNFDTLNNDTTPTSRGFKKYAGYGIPEAPLKRPATFISKAVDIWCNQGAHQSILPPSATRGSISPTNVYRNVLTPRQRLKTWIITHPTCLHHLAIPEPTDAPNKRHRLIATYPENPTRLEVIISNNNGILKSDVLDNVKLLHSPPPASLADVLRVHDWGYLNKLLNQVQIAQKRWITNSYWPILADGDTPVTPHSWSAALYAAGSVIAAVDAVCTGACRNAFCAVRPPGHHLGTWGGAHSPNFEDEDFAAGSQGFCLINNVAIGAAYAKYTYANRGIRRIAIVDFDVHHGNGTEQIIRNIGPKNIRCASSSRVAASSAATATAATAATAPSTSTSTSGESAHSIHTTWMGWRDERDREEVFFASIHAYDGVFYPGTGKPLEQFDDETQPRIINVALPQNTTSEEFKYAFETKICPFLYKFSPDLIFISAGFDGHYRDSVSFGFTKYTERDFFQITSRLVTIANTVCNGRIVSVLEGGYNTRLDTQSPFARCVLEHVNALVCTSDMTLYPWVYGHDTINFLFKNLTRSNSADSHNVGVVATFATACDATLASDQGTRHASVDVFQAHEAELETLMKHLHLQSPPPKISRDPVVYNAHSKMLDMHGNKWSSWYSQHFERLFKFALVQPSDVDKVKGGSGDQGEHRAKAIDEQVLEYHYDQLELEVKYAMQKHPWFKRVKLETLRRQVHVAKALYCYFHELENPDAFKSWPLLQVSTILSALAGESKDAAVEGGEPTGTDATAAATDVVVNMDGTASADPSATSGTEKQQQQAEQQPEKPPPKKRGRKPKPKLIIDPTVVAVADAADNANDTNATDHSPTL